MPYAIWILVAFVVGSYIATPLADPDLWWHVVVGKWILAHHELPTVDHWNMFAVGRPWRAYSWSNEIIYALFDNWRGVQGLLAAQIGLAILLSMALMWSFGRIARDYFWGGLLGIVSTAAMFSHFSLRPQVVTWILLALLLTLLNSQTLLTKLYGKALVLLIFAIWANSHVTAPLGLMVLFTWALSFGLRQAVQLAMIGLLGTFVTPYHGTEWLSLFEQTSHPISYGFIAEFQPATILQYATGFLVILISVLSIFVFRRPQAQHPARYLCCGAFLILAFAIVKFLPFAVIIVCALLAEMWAKEGWFAFGKLAVAIRGLNNAWFWLPAPGLSFLLFALGVVNVFNLWHSAPNALTLPVHAADFILENSLPAPLMVGFGDGGYMIYRFSNHDGDPSQLVSIDGRTNVTPAEIMEMYHEAANGREGWQRYLKSVKPNTILWRRESPLVNILAERPEWEEVYKDGLVNDGYVVFKKK